jgi:hypothetical protein
MEGMLYRGQRFVGGIKHFWMAVSVWKTSLVLKDLAGQKRKKMRSKVRALVRSLVRSDRRLTVRMIGSELSLKTNRQRHFDPGIVHGDTSMLCHDYDAYHTAISVNECLTKTCIPVVAQPTYSLNLSPIDLFLFPKLEFHLKVLHFETVKNTQKAVTDKLRAITHEVIQHCHREFVAFQSKYFEGDDVDF